MSPKPRRRKTACKFCGLDFTLPLVKPARAGWPEYCRRHQADFTAGRPMSLERRRAPPGQAKNTPPVVAHVTAGTRAELVKHADALEITMSSVVERALVQYLNLNEF